jgi:NADH kinase
LMCPAPPRNVLIIKKDRAPQVTESLIEYAKLASSLKLVLG